MGQDLSREPEINQAGGTGQRQQPEATSSRGAVALQSDPRRPSELIPAVNLSAQNEQIQRVTLASRSVEEIKDQLQHLIPSVLMESVAETLIDKLLQKGSTILQNPKEFLVPTLNENYYQIGEPQQTDLRAAIYTKIGPWRDADRSLPRNMKTNQLRISATLSIHGHQFYNRKFPFVIPPEIYLKLAMRTNPANLHKFLEEFCTEVQVLRVVQPSECEPLISFGIPYNSLLHQRESLLLQKFSIENDPVAHNLDCLICLETEVAPDTSTAGPSRAIPYVRSSSKEEDVLTKMCEELRTSSKLIDLAYEECQEASRSTATYLDEPMEPTDLSFKTISHCRTNPTGLKVLEATTGTEFIDKGIQSTQPSSDASTQTDVFKVEKRKHAGLSRDTFLRNKMAKLQTTNLDSATKAPATQNFPEPETNFETLKPTIITRPSTDPVALNVNEPCSKPPQAPVIAYKTVSVLRKDTDPMGSAVAGATMAGQVNGFKCTEKDCSQVFAYPAALRRHKKHVHSQQK